MTKPAKELLFLALGGSGEIGMNATLYGCEGKWILIDLGVAFGMQDYPGVEMAMPDIEFIEKRRADFLGIVLTHGHEDHIGALPHLAGELDVPLYANPFTSRLISRKLQEVGLEQSVELNEIAVDARLQLGAFALQLVPLSHSIPQMSAVLIETPYGRIFHSGDWKLDDEASTRDCAKRLTAIGDKGVDVLVCDSTNAFDTRASGHEESVRDGLMTSVAEAKGRVVVTSFASNVKRLEILGEVAQANRRHLALAGRSLERMVAAAREVGLLQKFPEVVDLKDAMSLPRDKLMIIATGGQGEHRAALSRISRDEHLVELQAGDRVVFSSRQIPGNEVAIGHIINRLVAMGVEIITEKQAHIHVSGHPARPELEQIYRWLRPTLLIPVHGEHRHMQAQAQFAKECGIPKTLVQSNGALVRLAPGGARQVERVSSGRLLLDGDSLIPDDGETIAERRKLARAGYMAVVLVFRDGLLHSSTARCRGLPLEGDREDFINDIQRIAERTARRKLAKYESLTEEDTRARLRESVRQAVRRTSYSQLGKKPMVDIIFIDS